MYYSHSYKSYTYELSGYTILVQVKVNPALEQSGDSDGKKRR